MKKFLAVAFLAGLGLFDILNASDTTPLQSKREESIILYEAKPKNVSHKSGTADIEFYTNQGVKHISGAEITYSEQYIVSDLELGCSRVVLSGKILLPPELKEYFGNKYDYVPLGNAGEYEEFCIHNTRTYDRNGVKYVQIYIETRVGDKIIYDMRLK